MRDCELGLPGEQRDRLTASVLAGRKTSTSSLLAEWEHEREPLPRSGERQRLLNSEGRVIAVIELTEVEVIRLGDADLALAIDEGEGFVSVQAWREAHVRFWREAVMPGLPAASVLSLGAETLVLVERFRVVEAPPGRAVEI